MSSEFRFFTLEKARQALVYIRPILLEIQIVFRTFLELEAKVQIRDKLNEQERDDLVTRLTDVRNQVDRLSREIIKTGAEVKDFESGIVNFFYKRQNGEIALLSYKLGEDTVSHWHTIDEAYDNRRPIAELIELERAALAGHE